MTVDPKVVASPDDDLLTRAEASAFLLRFGVRMKPSTLARLWSTGGDGPPCVHVRGKPLYPRGVLQTWAEAQSTGLRTSKAGDAHSVRHE
jgi:hypothetical protein